MKNDDRNYESQPLSSEAEKEAKENENNNNASHRLKLEEKNDIWRR